MDNNTLWTLTAKNVVKFCRVSVNTPKGTKNKTRKMRVRHAMASDNQNIKVVVTR